MKIVNTNHLGLTVIEVLTSIVVATIGVAGIMVLIPFAVGQAKQGFDSEMAASLGRNAADEFEVNGFNDTARWCKPDFSVADGVVSPLNTNVNFATARCYVIDPLGVTARLFNGNAADVGAGRPFPAGVFPFVHPDLEDDIAAAAYIAYEPALPPASPVPPPADTCFLIERRTLFTSLGARFTPGLARSKFSWSDDITYLEPTTADVAGSGYPTPDLAPPQQLFDQDATAGTLMRRQSAGEMSYIVVTSPTEIAPDPSSYPSTPAMGNSDKVFGFRNHLLIYKRRPMPMTLGTTGAKQPYDRVYQVDHPNPPYDPATNPYNRMAYVGGDLIIRETTTNTDLRDANSFSSQRVEIRRGDWMALTNVVYKPGLSRFLQQINFYQVLDSSFDDNGTPADPTDDFGRVTLQGPDFDFDWSYSGGAPDPSQDYATVRDYAAKVTSGSPQQIIPSKTYAIHLPDVWAVFERTYR